MVETVPHPWQHQTKTFLGQQHGIQIFQENSFPDNCDKCNEVPKLFGGKISPFPYYF